MSAYVPYRRLLTVAEAADVLRVSTRTARRMVADGRLPAVRLGGPRTPVRVDALELEAWLDSEPMQDYAA